MAIYHCSTKPVSRGVGHSACAGSAYQSGEKIKDERTGITHDYEKKQGVMYSEIISNLNIEIGRSELWNLAESSENRKDARTAREWIIALPHELDQEQRQTLAKDFAQSLVDRYGVVADLAIHEPSKQGDERNFHAHILVTTRKASLNAENELILGDKANIELSNAKRSILALGSTQNEIKEVRAIWADLNNQALKKADLKDKVDHRSYQEQGKDIEPTIHEGKEVTQLRRQGINTEISLHNDRVKQQRVKEPELSQQEKDAFLQQGLSRVDVMLQEFKQRQAVEQQKQAEQAKEKQIEQPIQQKNDDRGFSR